MALTLSARAKLLSQKRNVETQIIFEIDGVDDIYGSIDVLELANYGDVGLVYGLPGVVYGGSYVSARSKPYISLSGSSNVLSQQLNQDKGSAQSVTSMNIELTDFNQEITELITPGLVLPEILGVKTRVYLNFAGGSHPEDSILIHRGIISDVETSPTSVKFSIAHPEKQKQQQIFIKQSTVLTANVLIGDTTLTVNSTAEFITPGGAGALESYVKIGDELIKYTGKNDTEFIGCTRGELNTIAAAHSIDDNVDSFYRLQGNCVDLALWLMLSGGPSAYQSNVAVAAFNKISPTETIVGAILFNIYDVQDRYGLVIGDRISISSAINAINNITYISIIGFGKNDYGSYILTNEPTVLEINSTALASFASKYNILPTGLGMTPDDVDVERHEELKTRYVSSLPSLDLYIKDTIEAKDWLAKEIYLPAGLYTLPRKSKASCSITVPPVADQTIFKLDDTTLTEASKIKPMRSISKAFYNAIVFKYEQDSLQDKFLRAKINYSLDSQARIKNVGNKVMTIESTGLRDIPATETLIRTNSRRLLERYQFAAEIVPNLKPLYKEALAIEVGDVVIFGSSALKISDITTGNRNFIPKLYEVSNKELNFKTGAISLNLLSTNFSLDGRYGIISPNSYIGSSSTTTDIVIINSFNTQPAEKEKDKWTPYIGQTIRVRNTSFTFSEEVTLVGFDPTDDYVMQVSPALSVAPTSGMLIDAPEYSGDMINNSLWKLLHCFFDPQVLVVTGISNTDFTVGAGDVAKFYVGSIVRVHNEDFTIDSGEVIVSTIIGVTITVNNTLGFTPAAGQVVDLIGFVSDSGLPYRLI